MTAMTRHKAWTPSDRARNRHVSPLKWIGGKWLMARRLVQLMPQHITYCEVFGGAAHVLYRKPQSRVEVLNDINGELINFWRVLRDDADWLARQCDMALYSRELFYEYRSLDPASLDSRQRAWRFFYLNMTCFGGRMNPPSYGPPHDGHIRMAHTWARRLQSAVARLQQVQIENLDWRACLQRYDSEATLFYLDPPYMGHEKAYGPGWSRQSFAKLAQALGNIRGMFLLSINDCQEARETFAAYPLLLEPVVKYSVNRDRSSNFRELVFGSHAGMGKLA